MAIGAIGYFGRGDVMRQTMYWNAQRYRGMPLSSFAQGTAVDVGQMPGSVVEATNATPAVSGFGAWGVTSGQILSAAGGAALGPAGMAIAIARNNKTLAHARKQCAHFKALYVKLKKKNARDKRLAKVKAAYVHWCNVYAQAVRMQKAHQKAKAHRKFEQRHFKAVKNAIRKGRAIPLTPAQRRSLLMSRGPIASTTMGLQTGAQAASAAMLSTQGSAVPPGQYDYVSPAQALATTADSAAVSPAQLVAADVDINDDGVRDDIAAGGDGSGAALAASDAATAMGTDATNGDDEGFMAKVSDFFGGIPKWALILGVLGVGGLAFSRTRQGKLAFAKLKRKFQGRGSSAE